MMNKNMPLENAMGVHMNERSQTKKGKTVSDKFAEHCKLDSPYVAPCGMIDTNKRGKAKDITMSGMFELEEPELEE